MEVLGWIFIAIVALVVGDRAGARDCVSVPDARRYLKMRRM